MGESDEKAEGLEKAQAIFTEVADNFRNSLPKKEKEMFRTFDDPVTMVKDLQLEVTTYQESRKLAKLCKKIEHFSSAWAPFFDVVTIFVQSNPEFAALAWGAVRLVFLLGSNYTTFLEKIVSMLVKIGNALPGYAEYYERVVKRWTKIYATLDQKKALMTRQLRIAKALGYVYADIVQFCQEACKLFSTKKGGTRYKATIIADLFWKPFDVRFADLLDRMRSHEALFNRELQLEESKFMEMQFERREKDAEMAREVALQLQKQMHDLSANNKASETQLAAAFEGFAKKLEALPQYPEPNGGHVRQENELLESRVCRLKTWIGAPEYMLAFENARSMRAPKTCEWFLSSMEYTLWKSYRFSESGPESASMGPPALRISNPILLASAKPGFGKTTLSSLVIEDLGTMPVSTGLLSESECVLFYHFISERLDLCLPSHAWRAIASQLIHGCRNQKDVIDAVSILYDENSVGQATASDEEIAQCLKLLLSDFTGIKLIFDGIDECRESTSFLTSLHSLCIQTRTKALLFSRANADIPGGFGNVTYFKLDQAHNREDIALYLTPKIKILQEKSLISPDLSLRKIVTTLVAKSCGMFLWAYLMVRYLNCRALSPKERRETIFTANLVEGIESLYEAILNVLGKSYSIQRAKVQKIFWLMVVAPRPLSISELQFALAVRPGKVTDEEEFIPSLKEDLPVICGSLVEVSERDIVRFIHSSFRDFLTRHGKPSDQSFFVDIGHRHLEAASICLSHLIFDLPRSPLQWPNTSKESLATLKAIFPFLQYSLNWTHHAVSGIKLTEPCGVSSPLSSTYSTLMYLITKFMEERLSVTAWIESSWTLARPPKVEALLTQLSEKRDTNLHKAMSNYPGILKKFEEFSLDINRLHRDWGHLLVQEPSAIWTSSITAFTKSQFLYETSDFKVTSLAPTVTRQSFTSEVSSLGLHAILVQSQVSSSGLVLGIVQVVPSRTYTIGAKKVFALVQPGGVAQVGEIRRQNFIKIASSGWKVKYEQISTQTEEVILSVEFELPEEDIYQLLCQSLASRSPDRFPFPVALSGDLHQLVVLRTVITVRTGDDSQPSIKTEKLGMLHGKTLGASPDMVAYSTTFSPNGSALAFAIGTPTKSQIQSREVELWSREEVGNHEPHFIFKGSVMVSWLSMANPGDRNTSSGFLFHPSLPFIVFSEWTRISVWEFHLTGPEQRFSVTTLPGIPKRFTSPYTLVYSSWHGGAQFEAVPDQQEEEDIDPIIKDHVLDLSTLFSTASKEFFSTFSSESQALSILSETSGSRSGGWGIHRDHSTNAVILRNDGRNRRTETVLANLPRMRQGEQTFVSLLRFASNDRWMRMVLNKGPQGLYSVRDDVNPHLPCIISRKRKLDSGRVVMRRCLPFDEAGGDGESGGSL